jgi:hypothetical protein
MTTTYDNLITINLKNTTVSEVYEILKREAEKERTTLKQYVAVMRQTIVAKDKEMTNWERKLNTGSIPFSERARAMEIWDQCKKECFQLSKVSSLYNQHSEWLKNTKIIKPKAKKIQEMNEEDEWEMNVANFSL